VATKKLYFKIGEACKKLDIQPYVLRYWETEFSALSPDKSKSGQRVYTTKDLQVIGRIKELLYEEGFTIAGAKKKLDGELKTGLKPLHGSDGEGPTVDEAAVGTAAEESPAPVVDEASVKELESVRKGVKKALADAKGLLEYLDSEKKSS
jgi:DNA-binding transcriptional MerR regulator